MLWSNYFKNRAAKAKAREIAWNRTRYSITVDGYGKYCVFVQYGENGLRMMFAENLGNIEQAQDRIDDHIIHQTLKLRTIVAERFV
jgi:hypothetical protein